MDKISHAFLAFLALATTIPSKAQSVESPSVVFVCEHGSAKSVIAAAHFNRIAEQRGLPYRAVSRGVHPDPEIPEKIRTLLSADGLNVSQWKPALISDDDIRRAARVITIACELPKSKSFAASKVTDWSNVPPLENAYPEMRASILDHINALLGSLQESTQK